jgi:hypothetical protein
LLLLLISATFLVLFSTAAGAYIVTADFSAFPNNRRLWLVVMLMVAIWAMNMTIAVIYLLFGCHTFS